MRVALPLCATSRGLVPYPLFPLKRPPPLQDRVLPMTDELQIECLPDLIRIRAFGERTVRSRIELWGRVAAACWLNRRDRVLLEDHTIGEFSVGDILAVVASLPQTGLPKSTRTAIVTVAKPFCTHPPAARAALEMHGWTIRYFDDCASAVAWLTGNT